MRISTDLHFWRTQLSLQQPLHQGLTDISWWLRKKGSRAEDPARAKVPRLGQASPDHRLTCCSDLPLLAQTEERGTGRFSREVTGQKKTSVAAEVRLLKHLQSGSRSVTPRGPQGRGPWAPQQPPGLMSISPKFTSAEPQNCPYLGNRVFVDVMKVITIQM